MSTTLMGTIKTYIDRNIAIFCDRSNGDWAAYRVSDGQREWVFLEGNTDRFHTKRSSPKPPFMVFTANPHREECLGLFEEERAREIMDIVSQISETLQREIREARGKLELKLSLLVP